MDVLKDKYKQTIIDDMAKQLYKKIEGGRLFGEPIDFTNMNQVVVAVALMKESELKEK